MGPLFIWHWRLFIVSMMARRWTLAVTLCCVFALLLPVIAGAQTLDERKAQAEREISQTEQKLESALERYKYACSLLSDTKSEIQDNKEKLTEAEQELAVRQTTLNKRARSMYVSRPSKFIDVVASAKSFDQFLVGLDFMKKVGRNDATLVGSVKASKARLQAAREQLAEQKARQEEATGELARSKSVIESQLAQSKGRLASVQEEIRAAMARRLAEAESSARSGARSSQYYNVVRNTMPPGTPHPEVVGVAYDQLGKPYVWGATGPNSFDCSGLTSYCWRVGAGIDIPRNSYGQMTLPSVPIAAMMPGDIIGFRGWGHVGLYIGNNQFIQAPSSGDVVKITNLSSRRDFAGAVRP